MFHSGREIDRGRHVVEFLRQGSDAFVTSRLDRVLGWARKHSLSAYPFGSGCCAPALAASAGPGSDLAASVPRVSPRHADLLMVVGTITHRQAPVLKRIYDQMPEPKWVIAFGACSCSGGPYDNYAVVQGIDTLVPVDVYIPGCPPRPEALLDGVLKLQARIQAEPVPAAGRHAELHEIEVPVVERQR